MDLSDFSSCLEVETYVFTPRTNQSREFLESLVPLLEDVELAVYGDPEDWKYIDGKKLWAMHCLEEAVGSIQAEISRLG